MARWGPEFLEMALQPVPGWFEWFLEYIFSLFVIMRCFFQTVIYLLIYDACLGTKFNLAIALIPN